MSSKKNIYGSGDYFTERHCLRTTWLTIKGPKDVALRVIGQNSKLCLMAIVEKYNLLYYYLFYFINYFTILWWFLPYIDMIHPRVHM